MKKVMMVFLVSVLVIRSNAQHNFSKTTTGATCNCKQSNASCNAICTFSDCCICWDPETQNGACGCYWGISTCKSSAITASKDGLTIDENSLAESDKEAKLHFSFYKFSLLLDFFRSNEIECSSLQEVFLNTKQEYYDSKEKVEINYLHFLNIVQQYSWVIQKMKPEQKTATHNFIKSIE